MAWCRLCDQVASAPTADIELAVLQGSQQRVVRGVEEVEPLDGRVAAHARLAQALQIALAGTGIVQTGEKGQVALVAAQQDLAQIDPAVDGLFQRANSRVLCPSLCSTLRWCDNRHLTITLNSDWRGALRVAGKSAKADTYQGEVLNFESLGHFFGPLSEKRWEIVRACQGKGELSARALAREVGCDVKRVHEDVITLAELGLLERTESGGVSCPFSSVRIDMVLEGA